MNNSFDKFLPVGSVVLLSGGKKRVMITGYVAVGKETGNKVYDYIGCLYPEGVISSDKNLLFDHNQISQVFYMGYVDDEQKGFSEKLKQLVDKEFKSNNSVESVGQEINQPLNNASSSSTITFDDDSVVNSDLNQPDQINVASNNIPEKNDDPEKNDIFNSVPSSANV